MSRATAVPSSSAAITAEPTNTKKIYFSAQHKSNRGGRDKSRGRPLVVSRIPFASTIPYVEMTLTDYETFRWFMLHLYRINNGMSGLNCQKIFPVLYDRGVFTMMLQFLYADIAKLVAPKLQNSYMQMDRTALALYRPSNVFHELGSRTDSFGNLWNTPSDYSLYMSIRHKRCFLLQPVLKAAFNANLDGLEKPDPSAPTGKSKTQDGLKQHLESISPAARKQVLSEKGTIDVEHLKERYPGITRTGTPLQMAIYSDDEEMVAYLKTQMDEDEFHHQCREVFEDAINNTNDEIKLALKDKIASLKNGNATTEDYLNVMREVQQEEAKVLCADLQKMFTDVNVNDFSTDARYVAATTSTALPNMVDDFIKNKILHYVKTHPIYNPYLLQTVYDIYANLPSSFDRDCYFSQKINGGIQQFLSPRWLQHFTQDIEDLAEKKIAPHRSFICRDGGDIRNLVSSCVGVDSFLSILGAARPGTGSARRGGVGARRRQPAGGGRGTQNLCRAKTSFFQNLLRSQPQSVPTNLSIAVR